MGLQAHLEVFPGHLRSWGEAEWNQDAGVTALKCPLCPWERSMTVQIT